MSERVRLIECVDRLETLAVTGLENSNTPVAVSDILAEIIKSMSVELRGHIIKTTEAEKPAEIEFKDGGKI
jgi:hypothetical protein